MLVCDNVTNAPNVGSILRIADAFGVERVIFCGDQIQLGKRMTKTSRSTEKYVNYHVNKDITETVTQLKNDNYFILALEITTKSVSIQNFELTTNQPIAIVVGNENFGVSAPILQLSDIIIHIDMYGHNSSMNVTQAASIALFEITRQIKQS